MLSFSLFQSMATCLPLRINAHLLVRQETFALLKEMTKSTVLSTQLLDLPNPAAMSFTALLYLGERNERAPTWTAAIELFHAKQLEDFNDDMWPLLVQLPAEQRLALRLLAAGVYSSDPKRDQLFGVSLYDGFFRPYIVRRRVDADAWSIEHAPPQPPHAPVTPLPQFAWGLIPSAFSNFIIRYVRQDGTLISDSAPLTEAVMFGARARAMHAWALVAEAAKRWPAEKQQKYDDALRQHFESLDKPNWPRLGDSTWATHPAFQFFLKHPTNTEARKWLVARERNGEPIKWHFELGRLVRNWYDHQPLTNPELDAVRDFIPPEPEKLLLALGKAVSPRVVQVYF